MKTSFSFFIAKRFLKGDKGNFSSPLIRIATYSIALGLAVMVISMSILSGFKNEITNRVVGFGSHIVIKNYEISNVFEALPIDKTLPIFNHIEQQPGVLHCQPFAYKGGMVKTTDQIQAVVIKGIDFDFDTNFMSKSLIAGRFINIQEDVATNEVIISDYLAKKMNLGIGEKLRTYFWIDNTHRARAFEIVGIYETGLNIIDERLVVADLRQVQTLNRWKSSQVEGMEVIISSFDSIDVIAKQIYDCLSYDLTLSTIVEEYPSLFSWLDLLNANIIVILVIMAMVSIVSIISVLLIMIFEKTSMIGILKTMGCNNAVIRRIFLIKSAYIVAKGVLIGNSISLLFCIIQHQYKLLKLDPASYSVSYVPVDLNIGFFVILSVATFGICLIALFIPVQVISKIDPAKTIKVE